VRKLRFLHTDEIGATQKSTQTLSFVKQASGLPSDPFVPGIAAAKCSSNPITTRDIKAVQDCLSSTQYDFEGYT
jgi:hypothetical protein